VAATVAATADIVVRSGPAAVSACTPRTAWAFAAVRNGCGRLRRAARATATAAAAGGTVSGRRRRS